MNDYSIDLDREGAEWLTDQALDLFRSTRDYGWKEIADSLKRQLNVWSGDHDD